MRRIAPLLMYAGVVAIVFALGEYHGRYIGHYDFVSSFRFAWAVTYVVVLCVAAYGLGLPDLGRPRRGRIAGAVAAAGVGSVLMSAVQLFVGDALLPRFVVFGAAAGVVPLFVATSVMSDAGRVSLEARDRVFVVGSRSLESVLGAELADKPERPASLVGALSVEAAAGPIGQGGPLLEAVIACSATVLVLSPQASLDERIVDQAAQLHERGLRVRTQSLFYEEWLAKLPVSELGRVALFFDIGEVHRERYSRFKRIIDVATGVVGILVLGGLIPLVLVGNAIGNRGPLFFVQDRIGRGGQPFRIVKFRTMRQSDTAAVWTTSDDPRITPFGRYMRITHADEVPQVWNILRGDLSLVGPRPEQPAYVAELKDALPFYDLRHIVRPGLTGWAQVKYGYAGDERDALEKLQYDFHYLRRQSLLFDLQIVGRTVRSVVGGQGRGR